MSCSIDDIYNLAKLILEIKVFYQKLHEIYNQMNMRKNKYVLGTNATFEVRT